MTLNNVTKINTEENYNLIYLEGELRIPYILSFARPDVEKDDWDQLKKTEDGDFIGMERLMDMVGAEELCRMIWDGNHVIEKPWKYLHEYSEIYGADFEYFPDLI